MLEIFLLIYATGFIVCSIKSVYFFSNIIALKEYVENIDILKHRPGLKWYCIVKPFLWPYFLVTEDGPMVKFSELFFSRYGDGGKIYFGNQGLKNFLNDVFFGKKRYQNYRTKQEVWRIDTESEEYKSCPDILKKLGCDIYAIITGYKHGEKYFLQIVWSRDHAMPKKNVSRFTLDRCQRLNMLEFTRELEKINKEKTKEFVFWLNAESEPIYDIVEKI